MTTQSDSEYLRARYGAHRSDRRIAIVAAGVAILATVAWFVWYAITLANPAPTAEAVALDIVSDSQVDVTITVTASDGATVTCTVRAYTDAMTEVGVMDVTVGPLDGPQGSASVEIPTIQPATGARVGDCRAAGS